MKKQVGMFLGCCIVVLIQTETWVLARQDGNEVRRWTSASGKFSIQATFSGVEDGKIRLQKTDQSIVKVDISKLSTSDQEYLKQLLQNTPTKSTTENIWIPKVGDTVEYKFAFRWVKATVSQIKDNQQFVLRREDAVGTTKSLSELRMPTELAFPCVTLERDNVIKIESVDQELNIPTIQPTVLEDIGDVRIAVPKGIISFSTRMKLDQSQSFAVMVDNPDQYDKLPLLSAFEFKSKKLLGTTVLPLHNADILDISSDKRMLLSRTTAKESFKRLDQWEISADGSLIHHGGIEVKYVVKFATYLANGRIVALNSNGEVSVYEISSEKASEIFSIRGFDKSAVHLAHDKKTLLLTDKAGFLNGYDLLNGICLGRFRIGSAYGMALNKDQSKIAISSFNRFRTFTTSGKMQVDFFSPNRSTDLQWIDDRYVSMGPCLADLQKRVSLTFGGIKWHPVDQRGNFWLYNPNGRLLTNQSVLTPHIIDQLPEDLDFALEPGDSASIKIIAENLPDAEAKKVRSLIEEVLLFRGVQVIDDGKYRIEVTDIQSELGNRNVGFWTSISAYYTLFLGDRKIMRWGGSLFLDTNNSNIENRIDYDFFNNFELPKHIVVYPPPGFPSLKFE